MTALPDVPPRRLQRRRALVAVVLALLGLVVGMIAEGGPASEASATGQPIAHAAFADKSSVGQSPRCNRNDGTDAAGAVVPAIAPREGGNLPLAMRAAQLEADAAYWTVPNAEGQGSPDRPLSAPHLTTVLRI
ncbi:hypothetical protein AB0N05_10970 [Nocardia sp. NPDC051030]|uniref:hypothetical protein n=1 Tax=Nocardia sp. NPDC051030 TaxID=3155162 RepID=UPI003442AD14